MKKLLTLFAAAVLAVGAYAQTTPSIKAVAAEENSQFPGMASIVWQADSTLSKVYVVALYAADTTSGQTTPIAFLTWPARAYAMYGYTGLFSISTRTVLEYGMAYPKMKDNTEVSADVIARYKAGWEASVEETGITLFPGFYYVIVIGYDANLSSVTESQKGALFEIADKTQGVENVFETTKPVKFIAPDGQVRILRDGKMYNMSGMLVK